MAWVKAKWRSLHATVGATNNAYFGYPTTVDTGVGRHVDPNWGKTTVAGFFMQKS